MKKSLALAVVFFLVIAFIPAQTPSLGSASFSLGGPSSTLLTLSAPGRVSIRAASPLGVGISLVDRMEGEIARSGSGGGSDGRIDISLDAGVYRVALDDLKAAGGRASLEARTFAPANGSAPAEWPRLLEGAVTTGSLQDLESASFWIEQRKDGPLELEAMGRDLASVEIWRDASYLIGSWSPTEERQVETGRPMGWLSVSRMTKAGHYLVRLYGREARKWADENGKHPFLLRSGFLRLPAGGRLDFALSAFGRDFVLARGIDTVTATRQTKGSLVLAGGDYRVGQGRLSGYNRAVLDGKGSELSLSLGLSSGGDSLLRVEAKPGEAIALDACRARGGFSIPAGDAAKGGILSLIVPRTGQPFLDPTGIVYRVPKGATKPEILYDFAAPLSSNSSFRGRVARLSGDRLEVYLRADEAGTYRVAEKTGMGQASALYQVYPLDLYLQSGSPYLQPAPAASASFMLTKGYYLLTIDARSLGTLDFAVYRDRLGGGGGELAREPAPRGSRNWSLPAGTTGPISVLAGDSGLAGTGFSFATFPSISDPASPSPFPPSRPSPAGSAWGRAAPPFSSTARRWSMARPSMPAGQQRPASRPRPAMLPAASSRRMAGLRRSGSGSHSIPAMTIFPHPASGASAREPRWWLRASPPGATMDARTGPPMPSRSRRPGYGSSKPWAASPPLFP